MMDQRISVRIIGLLERSRDELSAYEIAVHDGMKPSAVTHMLDTAKGYMSAGRNLYKLCDGELSAYEVDMILREVDLTEKHYDEILKARQLS